MKWAEAYKILRDAGMRPAMARFFMDRLRRSGFVIIKEKELVRTKQINRKIEIIIKLMKIQRKKNETGLRSNQGVGRRRKRVDLPKGAPSKRR